MSFTKLNYPAGFASEGNPLAGGFLGEFDPCKSFLVWSFLGVPFVSRLANQACPTIIGAPESCPNPADTISHPCFQLVLTPIVIDVHTTKDTMDIDDKTGVFSLDVSLPLS